MAESTARQARIDLRRAEVTARYPDLWRRIIDDWHSPGPEDRAWLIYSANYLFRTGNIRWALDPLRLKNRLPLAAEMEVAEDLKELSFVLLTHSHADHLDLGLINALQGLPIRWVVPDPLRSEVIERGGLSSKRLIPVKPMEPIRIEGITILPIDGLHWEMPAEAWNGKPVLRLGVPATAYLVEFNHKRWLLPGDIRTFDAGQWPSLTPVDGVFAHLWLGRGCALVPDPPLLDAFCRFYAKLKPHQIVVSHLEEFGRQAEDYWDDSHYQMVLKVFRENVPSLQVTAAYMGNHIDL